MTRPPSGVSGGSGTAGTCAGPDESRRGVMLCSRTSPLVCDRRHRPVVAWVKAGCDKGPAAAETQARVLLNICYAGQPESYGSDVWEGLGGGLDLCNGHAVQRGPGRGKPEYVVPG